MYIDGVESKFDSKVKSLDKPKQIKKRDGRLRPGPLIGLRMPF